MTNPTTDGITADLARFTAAGLTRTLASGPDLGPGYRRAAASTMTGPRGARPHRHPPRNRHPRVGRRRSSPPTHGPTAPGGSPGPRA